jgi:Sulfatase
MPKEPSSSPAAPSAETPDVLPRPDFHFQGQIGRTYLDSDPAQFPQPVTAPKGAPNILLVLIDDCGFGQYGTFGGGIPSPTMDKLASEGLRYNRFHTTALCSPTRAALITGRNHHSTSFAIVEHDERTAAAVGRGRRLSHSADIQVELRSLGQVKIAASNPERIAADDKCPSAKRRRLATGPPE